MELCLCLWENTSLTRCIWTANCTSVEENSDAQMPDLTQGEEASLILAVSLVLGPKMAAAEDTARFRTLLRDVFPQSARPKSGSQNYSPQLVSAIEDQLQQDGMQSSQDFINKVYIGSNIYFRLPYTLYTRLHILYIRLQYILYIYPSFKSKH